MTKLFFLSAISSGFLLYQISGVNAQGVGINSSGNPADPSAMLDVSGTNSGVLINRMTTSQRDAISNPAQALQIYNLTTKCVEIYEVGLWQSMWCSCIQPAAAGTISGSATPCQGATNVAYSVGAIANSNGYVWTLPTGASIAGGANTSSITVNFSGGASSGNITVHGTSASCGNGAVSPNFAVTVGVPPTVASAGSDINLACGLTSATLSGNAPSVGTGNWSVISGTATITSPGSPTSGVTGLVAAGSATLRWTISNPPCLASTDDVVITTTACGPPPCTWNGSSTFTITHTAGNVAPVTKSNLVYGQAQTNLSGASKCWITQNLGASNQATSIFDGTENSAGWYWQFNRKQGYKHDGTTRTPNSSWIPAINENSNWLAANDPCTIELGAGWRIPTYTEWNSADANGQVGGWDNYNETFADVLKLHGAGYLNTSDGALSLRGAGYGFYWCSSQGGNEIGWDLDFSGSSSSNSYATKSYGFSVRCLRD